MSKCIEIIVYSVKPEKVDEFRSVKNTLIQEAKTLEGLVSSTTSVSVEDECVYLDEMEWRSVSDAKNGLEQFKQLPTTGKFMDLLSGPPVFSGKFETMS